LRWGGRSEEEDVIIITDVGDAIVNFEATFAVSLQAGPDGQMVAVAFGPGVHTVLTVGSEDRARQCLHAVAEAAKGNWKILDLRDKLGQRPNLTVPKMQIVMPGNGGPTA
jgi:hypothetical protein